MTFALRGFPGGAQGKEPACRGRRQKRRGFDPWVGRIPWRRTRQLTPVLLPGESHGQRSLVGYSPWGRREPDTTGHTHRSAADVWASRGGWEGSRARPPGGVERVCSDGRGERSGGRRACRSLRSRPRGPGEPQGLRARGTWPQGALPKEEKQLRSSQDTGGKAMPPTCLSIPRASCPVVTGGGSWEGVGAAWASARPPPFLGGCGGFSEEGRATLLGGGWTLVGRGGGTGQSLGQASIGGRPGPLISACPLQPRLGCLCAVCRACPVPVLVLAQWSSWPPADVFACHTSGVCEWI